MFSKRADFVQDFIKPLQVLGVRGFPTNNKNGDTGLHRLINQGASSEAIGAYLAQLALIDGSAPSLMAKTVNNEGMLPSDLLTGNSKNADKQKISSLLLSYMSPLELKPISESLDFSAFLKPYENELTPRLASNFQLAIFAATATRKALHLSDTHPEAETYSKSKKTALVSKIDKLRKRARELANQIRRSNPGLDSQALKKLILEEVASLYIKNGVGNCEEYSQLALYFAIKKDPTMNAEIFACGDHGFVVLDRDPKSKLNDCRTWGKDALICDPWRGIIYPVFALQDVLIEMRTCYVNGVERLVAIKFNPQFHKLELRSFFQAPNSEASKQEQASSSFFKDNPDKASLPVKMKLEKLSSNSKSFP